MPEGPELHCAAKFVNVVCQNRVFRGQVVKSIVSKNPDVPWAEPAYKVCATARGKEIKLTLTSIPDTENDDKTKEEKNNRKKPTKFTERYMDILFTFGMSGRFKFVPLSEIEKHAHLNMFTREGDMVLSFVDCRRFGRWQITSDWGKNRGPCVITEYHMFR